MHRPYPVLLNKDPGTEWWISFVDINAHTAGATIEDALASAQEAFELFMEDESALPKATPLEIVVESEGGREAMAVMLALIDVSTWTDTGQG